MEENELKLDPWVVNDEIWFIGLLEDIVEKYVTTPDGKMIVADTERLECSQSGSSGNANPKGYEFFEMNSCRLMRLVYEGVWKGWIVYKHPDGQWVTLREATIEDWHGLAKAMSDAIHNGEQRNKQLTHVLVDYAV